MNQLSKVFGTVAVAAAALCASQAYASGQFALATPNYLGDATHGTYIGIMDPSFIPTENATIASSLVPVNASFNDFWVLDVIPSGNVALSLSFLNISAQYSAFSVSLLKDQAPITNLALAKYTCASQSQAGGAVACLNTGPGVPVVVPTTNSTFGVPGPVGFTSLVTNAFLTAGRYVVRVSGTTVGGTNPSYSGQIQVNQIPEPGTLALAGLAMLGAAVSLRRRKTAA